jgi:hypothetical protein
MSGSSTNHLSTPLSGSLRIPAILAFLAAAVLLFLAAARPDWWSSEASKASLGLRSVTVCSGGASCTTGDLVEIDRQWGRVGLITWVSALLGGGLFVFSAGALAAGRRPRWLARTALVAAVTAGATTALFLHGYPGYAGAERTIAPLLDLGGALLGIVAALLVLRAPASPPSGSSDAKA